MNENAVNIHRLSDRHPWVTRAIGDGYAEAAEVCLGRHHEPPSTLLISDGGTVSEWSLDWQAPGERENRAWANEIDATEAGAYGVSLAAVEAKRGMVAVMRAATLTGADYYVAPVGSDIDDLENCLRLEVSGTDVRGVEGLNKRLKEKVKQAQKGRSNLPAMAAVVGFNELAVVLSDVELK